MARGQKSSTGCPASRRWCLAVGVAGGQPLVERWDGQWSRLPATSLGGATLLAVSCVSTARCVAAGSAGRAVSAIWNGTSWTAAAVPGPATAVVSELAGISCTARSFCMAVGDSQRKTGGLQTQLAESWNGSRWTPQALPDAGLASALISVSCTAAAACTAVGKISPRHAASARPSGPDKGLAERWNGKRWARQSMPALKVLMGGGTEMTGDNPLLTGVSCSGATQCLAVGSDHCCAAGGVWGAIGARWDGRQWTAARPFIPADHWYTAMNGVSCAAASRCEAVGVSARAIQYQSSTLAERWNGSVWTQQAAP